MTDQSKSSKKWDLNAPFEDADSVNQIAPCLVFCLFRRHRKLEGGESLPSFYHKKALVNANALCQIYGPHNQNLPVQISLNKKKGNPTGQKKSKQQKEKKNWKFLEVGPVHH